MPVSIQKEISILRQHPAIGRYLGVALQRLEDAVNQLGVHTATDPTGTVPAPPAIQKLTIKTDGNGTVHGTIDDNNPISRGLHYFVEYDTTPAFSRPHVVHLGVSRTMHPFILPAKDDDGNAQQFYFRGYSHYPGGEPGPPLHFGGDVPTPVSPGGTSQMTLLPSTGSGTAPNDGQRGASGFGKVLHRLPVTVKRVSA